ncbi:CPBP family intramembrane metalloprotease [Fusobacteria bacterium ZRK30]|nr:CPBP family intramembrane metalloprotease [Fusobacteria bacterium ZRK30]
MENQAREGKFELSVLGAVWMVVFYNFIVMFIILIPFQIVIELISFKDIGNVKVIMDLLRGTIIDIIIIVLALKKVKKVSNGNFKIKFMDKFNYKLLFSVIFLIGGYYLLYESSIGIMMEKVPVPQFIEEGFEEMFLHPYSAFISTGIRAPIFEEILMRGIILTGLLNRYSPRKAIIASALIFGACHLNIPQFVDATLGGLILGMIYYKTNSLFLCIAAHMTNNMLCTIMEYTEHSFNMTTFFIGVLIFLGSTMLFFRYLKELDESLKVDRSYKNQEVL